MAAGLEGHKNDGEKESLTYFRVFGIDIQGQDQVAIKLWHVTANQDDRGWRSARQLRRFAIPFPRRLYGRMTFCTGRGFVGVRRDCGDEDFVLLSGLEWVVPRFSRR